MMDLSIVIPTLNEADKIRSDIQAASAFIAAAGFEGEVIIVDDGSTDGTAETAQTATLSPAVNLKVLRLDKNYGKGFSLKTGIRESQGKIVLCADSGNCIPFANALQVIQRIRAGELDIALASRRHRETIIRRNRSLKRRVFSWLFHQAAVWFAGLPRWISDSQCGFKVFRGEAARQLFAGSTTSGYAFELEILLAAIRQGLRIEEFPVEWTCDLDSRLHPGSEIGPVFEELRKIRKIKKRWSRER
jgi:dolichyl-phosphate beta-glucosyltransferase